MCTECCTKGGSSGPMQCVWKEGGCELSLLHNMWLLGARVMFGSVAHGFVCKMCRDGERKVGDAADEFRFEDVKLECVQQDAGVMKGWRRAVK